MAGVAHTDDDQCWFDLCFFSLLKQPLQPVYFLLLFSATFPEAAILPVLAMDFTELPAGDENVAPSSSSCDRNTRPAGITASSTLSPDFGPATVANLDHIVSLAESESESVGGSSSSSSSNRRTADELQSPGTASAHTGDDGTKSAEDHEQSWAAACARGLSVDPQFLATCVCV